MIAHAYKTTSMGPACHGCSDHVRSPYDHHGRKAAPLARPVVGSAGESVIFQRSTPELEPFEEAGANIVHQLKLNWPTGLLLNHGGSGSNFPVTNDAADPDLHQVTAAKLAVEEGPIPNPSVLIKKEADRPYLAGFERPLRPNLPSGVPRYSLASGGIKF